MANRLACLVAAIALLQVPLSADLLQFSTFGTSNLVSQSANPIYVWTNNGLSGASAGGTFQAGTNAVNGAEVSFQFDALDIPAADVILPLPTQYIENAYLIRSSSVSGLADAASVGSGQVTQAIGSGSITFEWYDPTQGAEEILLQISGAYNCLIGALGGTTANFEASSANNSCPGSPNNNYAFSSSYINFANVGQTDRSVALSTISPALSVNSNGYLNSFNAQATGTFSADFAPPTPEPDNFITFAIGLGFVGGASWLRAKLRNRYLPPS